MSLHNRRPLGRLLLVALAAVLLVALASACGKKDKTLAEYDGGQVTEKEFTAFKTFFKLMSPYGSIVDVPEYQEVILKQYIGYKLLSGRATEEARTQGSAEVDEQFDMIKSSLEANDQAKQLMEDGGLTFDQMKTFMYDQSITLKDAELKVTEEQSKKYYDDNKSEFDFASVRHVLIAFTDKEGKERTKEDALKLADEVKGKLVAGGDWAELVTQYSDDTASVPDGGLYAKANPEGWVEAFKNAAKTLPINEISDPVETEYGYHVMKVEERGTKTYEESLDTIRGTLGSETISKFMEEELDGLITKIDLPPVPSESPSASPTASGSPDPSAPASPPASPSASPTSSPAASQ